MAKLNIHSTVVAFGDPETTTTQPKLQYFNWTTDYSGISVDEPRSKEYLLDPQETKSVFSGTRTLLIDGTSAFALTLNPVLSGVYRMTNTAGTAPGFRTDRALTISGETLSVVVNNNATVDFVLAPTSTPTFAAVQPGDTVFIPDATTGDAASPFNVMNVGFWVVLAKGPSGAGANRKLTCRRPATASFIGTSEAVAVVSNAQFIAYSSGPVQPGDYMVITAGFSPVSQKTFQITTVTPSWIEFASGESLPLETAILPGAAGVSIYSDAQSFIRVEVDQEAVVRLNGATGDYIKLTPRTAGDVNSRAYFEMWGTVWDLVVINKSPSSPMRAVVLTAGQAL